MEEVNKKTPLNLIKGEGGAQTSIITIMNSNRKTRKDIDGISTSS